MDTWRDHQGRPAPDLVFGWPPPPQIGRVLSAWSNRGPNGIASAFATVKNRIALAVGAVVTWASLAVIASAVLHENGAAHPWVVAALVPGVLVGALVFSALRRREICHYVGEEGIAEYRVGALMRPKERVLRFADAESLWASRLEMRINFFYAYTSYSYAWRDAGGRVVFQKELVLIERGLFLMDNRTADRDFLRAAGLEWSIVRWARAQEQLTGTGSASFRLARKGNLTIGPTRIELSYGKLPRSIEVANVEGAAVENGALLIFERNAIAVRLPLRDVADAEVVVRALTEVAGLKFARDRS